MAYLLSFEVVACQAQQLKVALDALQVNVMHSDWKESCPPHHMLLCSQLLIA